MEMHTRPLGGEFLVNGARCNLSVEKEFISWSPINKINGDKKVVVVGADTTKEKRPRRVEFANIVGMKRIPMLLPSEDIRIKIYYSKQNERSPGQKLLKLKKLSIESPAYNSKSYYRINDENHLSTYSGTAQAQVEKKSTQLTVTTGKNSNHSNKETHLQVSEPPSCYASEGSSSHLSSLTSHSTASLNSSPIQNLACDESVTSLNDNSTKLPSSSSSSSSSLAKATHTRSLDKLAQHIEQMLELKRKKRPKRLLIFVNPFGGKGRASQLYKSQVRYLLELAGIEAKLIVTKYANHARDTIEDPSFNVEHYDGIVCVGGDGMFSELMNGLLFRYNRDKILASSLLCDSNKCAINGNDNDQSVGEMNDITSSTTTLNAKHQQSVVSPPFISRSDFSDTRQKQQHQQLTDTTSRKEQQQHLQQLVNLRAALGGIGQQFVSPSIPVGVIGAGSTDANSFGLIGTNDVITATLNIILGNQIKIDVCSVHSIQEDSLLRFVSTFVAYGYFGDVVRESEKLRWLGPSRYDVTGFNNLIKNRVYKGLVRILLSNQDGSPHDLERCYSNCKHCNSSKERQQNDQELRFVDRQGSFIGVNAAVTACRCPQTKKGFSPNNHLANGCVDLILVRPCTRVQYFQYLLRTAWTKKSAFDLKYVEAHRCRQFEFFAQKDPSKSSSSNSTLSSATASSASSVDTGSNSNSLDSKQSSGHQLSGDSIDESAFSSWNVDGEILNEQSIRVKVNNQLLRVFGTGEPNY